MPGTLSPLTKHPAWKALADHCQQAPYRRRIRVHHPLAEGRLVLRTERDWEQDILPAAVEDDGMCSCFDLEDEQRFLYFKPCLRTPKGLNWAEGPNLLTTLIEREPHDVFPFFHASPAGSFAPLVEFDSAILGRRHRVRVYLPPGYEENTLKRYPVVYMQDGRNLFFPEEAFNEQVWRVDETVAALDRMSLIDKLIAVGIYSDRREEEYTLPGYDAYGRSLTTELKPRIDLGFRTHPEREHTLAVGSSLGGVVSFYLGWQYPQTFRAAACLSSSFGVQDDLLARVLAEPRRDTFYYLDSGWPNDNYEATMSMAMALIERGWRLGNDLMYLVFPEARHDEASWAARLHLPLQMFGGRVRYASRAARLLNGDRQG